MTISTRQSVERTLCSNYSTTAVYPINGYALVGQCVDMLWSRPKNKKGELG